MDQTTSPPEGVNLQGIHCLDADDRDGVRSSTQAKARQNPTLEISQMNRISAAVVASAAALGAILSTASMASATANQDYQAGPYTTSSKCTTARLVYVRNGGFAYVGPCFRQPNNRWYFNYH
jgi:hypothetical protein